METFISGVSGSIGNIHLGNLMNLQIGETGCKFTARIANRNKLPILLDLHSTGTLCGFTVKCGPELIGVDSLIRKLAFTDPYGGVAIELKFSGPPFEPWW